jgi:hypothetical protein
MSGLHVVSNINNQQIKNGIAWILKTGHDGSAWENARKERSGLAGNSSQDLEYIFLPLPERAKLGHSKC